VSATFATCLRQAGEYWDGYYGVTYKGLEETTAEGVVRYLRIF